jgi:O-methyltransferase
VLWEAVSAPTASRGQEAGLSFAVDARWSVFRIWPRPDVGANTGIATPATSSGVPSVTMMFEDFPGWRAARPARATGPHPDVVTMRGAYLELLKLCLCDLGGASTTSVGKEEDGSVMSRELSGEELRLRAAGMDWPLHGLTMVGLNRLDDLQRCIESVLRADVEGDLIEAGAWRGGASILMRATLDSLGARERTVFVADSFEGFPSPDDEHPDRERLNVVDFLAAPLEEVKSNFARFGCDDGVSFVPGFFQETMPSLSGLRWSIIRLDGDSYEATLTTLQWLYPGLSVGGYLIVDDYGALDECRQAVEDFRRQHGITEPLEEVDWTCRRWRRESEAVLEPPDAGGSPAGGGRGAPARPVVRRREARVPTEQEVALSRELGTLRERLAAAEAEIDRLNGSPLSGPKAWLRRKLQARRGTA